MANKPIRFNRDKEFLMTNKETHGWGSASTPDETPEVATDAPVTEPAPFASTPAEPDGDLDLSWTPTPVPANESAKADADASADAGAEVAPDDAADPTVPRQSDAASSDGAKKPGKKLPIGLIAGIGAAALVVVVVAVLFLTGVIGSGISGDVAAKVNSQKITIKQLDAEIAKIKLQNPQIFDAANGGMDEDLVRKQLLDELINRVLIQEAAEKEGVKASDEDVQTQIDSIKAGYPDDAGFEDALKSAGYTLDSLKEQIKYDLYAQGLISAKVPDDSVTAEEIQKYYDENKANYVDAAGKKASHILFAAEDKKKAQSVLADLKKSTDLEKDFAEAAKKYSTDTASATNGGDLGWPTQAYVEDFQKALDKLDVNEMSDLVKTEYGYHIILATDERKESTKPFDEVKDQIKETLLNEKRNTEYTTLLETLKKEAKITILDPAIKAYDKKAEAAEKAVSEGATTGTDDSAAPADAGDATEAPAEGEAQ
jgi:parvulin-like peptidyl-prolyl isomerase